MNCRLMVVLAVIALSLAVPGIGYTQNSIVEFEIPFSVTTEAIECLGEAIEADFTVTVRTQYIELTNGQVHYVESWFMEGTAVGLSSGLTWYARGPSPFLANASGARVTNTLIANITFEPLDGGQKFIERLRLQLVVDPNGVLRVGQEQHQRWRCLGA